MCGGRIVTMWYVEVTFLKADGYKMLLLLLLPMPLWSKKRCCSLGCWGKIPMAPLWHNHRVNSNWGSLNRIKQTLPQGNPLTLMILI